MLFPLSIYSPSFIENSYLLIPLSSSWAEATTVIEFDVVDVDMLSIIGAVVSLALNIAYKVISVSVTVSSVKASVALESVFHPMKS